MLNLPTFYSFLHPYTRFLRLTVVILFFPFLLHSHTNETTIPTQVYLDGNDGSSPIRIYENLPEGSLIGTLSSDNAANPTSTHSYTFIVGFNDNHRYRIVGDQLFTAEIFDFEQVATHMIQIRSTDDLGMFYDKTFTITIENLNLEVPPVTSSCSYTLVPPVREIDCGGTATTVTGTTTSSLTFSTFGVHEVLWTFSCPTSTTTAVFHVLQEITIQDTDPPVTPTLSTISSICDVTLIPPTTTDACDGIITGTTSGSLTISGIGSQTVVWTFTDSSGNSTTADQLVVIDPGNSGYLLTSPASTESQTVCNIGGPAFEDITYFVDTTSSTPTVTGLPAGIFSAFDPTTRILRIFGTPAATVSPSTYTFAVQSVVSGCVAFFEGTINVTTAAELELISPAATANQTQDNAVCEGNTIEEIRYEMENAQGAVVTGLPPGVTYNVIGNTIRIFGVPEVTGTHIQRYTYTVSTLGNSCGSNASLSGEIQVLPLINIDAQFIRANDIVHVTCPGGNDGSILIPEDPLQFQNRIMGDANDISQVDHLLLNQQPEISDIYTFRLNGVDYSYIVTPSSFGGPAQTPREVAQAIVDQINLHSTEVSASLTATSTIVLTANTPGTPFTIDSVMVTTSGIATITHVNITPNRTSSYSYQWSGPNGFTSSQLQIENLVAGTYTLEVSINNCNATTAEFVIEEPTPVVLDTNFCNGSFELNISGGVTPYTVNLFDRNGVLLETLVTNEGERFTDLTPGSNYLVEVLDSQCPVSVQRAIEFPFELSFDSSVPVLVNDFCNDSEGKGFIELGGNAGGESFSGGSNQFSYSWVGPNFRANTRDIYNLNPGVYTVTVTDKEFGCQHRESFEIFSVNPIIIEATSQTVFNSQNQIELACEGEETALIEVTVSGGVGNYVYTWTKNGNTLLGENRPLIENVGVGIYELTVRDETPSGTPTDIEPCVVSRSFEVVGPGELSFFVNDNAATNIQICPGDTNTASYDIEIFGGIPPFNVITTAANGTRIETEVDASRKKTITGLNPSSDGDNYTIMVTDSNACESQTTSSTLTFESIEAVEFRYTVEQIDCVAGTLGSIQLNVVSGSIANEESIQVNWKSIGVDIYDTWANGNGALQNISTAGTYQAIVTQGNCELYRSDPIAITDSNNNQLYLNDIQIEGGGCDGREGSITLDIVGGYPPLSIEWEAYRAVTSIVSATGTSSETTETTLQWVSLPQYANNAVALGLELGTYRATVRDSSSATSSEICSRPQTTPNIVIGTSVFELTNFQIVQENACEAANAEINFSVRNTLPNPNNIEYSPQITLDGNNPGSNLIALGNQNYKIINVSEGNHTLNITTGTTSAVLGNFSSCAIAHPFVIEALEPIQYAGETQYDFSACDPNLELAIDTNLITGGTPYIINGASVYDFLWTYTPEELSDPSVGTQNFVGDKIVNPAPGSYELIISDSENCSTDPIVFTVSKEEGFEPFVVRGTLRETNGTVTNTQTEMVKALPPNCSGNQSNGQIGIAISGGLNPYVIEWYMEEVSPATDTNANYVQIPEAQNRTHLQNLRAGNYKLIIRSQNTACEMNTQTNNRYYEEIIRVPNSDELRFVDGPYVDEDLCKGLPGRIILELFDNAQSELTFYYNNEILSVDTDTNIEDSRVIVLFVENPVNDAELVVTNAQGCSLSAKIQIEDLNVPEFEFSSPSLEFENKILAKEEIEFQNNSTGFYAYSTWNFGDGTQTQEIPRTGTASPVLHAYGISGTYLVRLRNYSSSGCFEETVKQIVVGSGYNIIAPNAFSPNGDLINDKYRVLFSGFKKVNFNVYDHLGNLLHAEQIEEEDPVFISNLELQGWGGTNAPKNSPYFIYHFSGILISDESEITRSGTFVLIP